jgi:hypothetical protein
MKKVLILFLVLGMASLASATIIDVRVVDVGQSGGRAGTEEDPLQPSDIVGLEIVLNFNPYPGTTYPSYDGYATAGVGVTVDIGAAGPGTLSVLQTGTKTKVDTPGFHADWELEVFSGVSANAATFIGGDLNGVVTGTDDPTVLFFNLLVHADEAGVVVVDLIVSDEDSQWALYSNFNQTDYSQVPLVDIELLVDDDLGDTTIHIIPEPMTIGLLGLGGLALLRRRRV